MDDLENAVAFERWECGVLPLLFFHFGRTLKVLIEGAAELFLGRRTGLGNLVDSSLLVLGLVLHLDKPDLVPLFDQQVQFLQLIMVRSDLAAGVRQMVLQHF